MADLEYASLLKRAREELPEAITTGERFSIPGPEVFEEGKTTVWRNFEEICSAIHREPAQVLVYLLRELGTAGTQEGRRVVLKGRVTEKQITDRVKSYVEGYVLCHECNRPDTRLVKEGRVTILECDACGAHRPVKVRKPSKAVEEDAIKEGGVYEMMIQDIGRKGDGIAKLDRYIIYVPGTAKGSIVKVEIEKVAGTVAFGHVVRE
jgi:translation initiation factor 2 subunit 2